MPRFIRRLSGTICASITPWPFACRAFVGPILTSSGYGDESGWSLKRRTRFGRIPSPDYGLGPVGNGHAAMGLTAVFAAVLAGPAGICASCPRDGVAGFTADLAAGLREAFLAPAFLIFAAGLRAAFFFDAGFPAGFLLDIGFFTAFLAGFFAGFGFLVTLFAFFLVAIFAISIKN